MVIEEVGIGEEEEDDDDDDEVEIEEDAEEMDEDNEVEIEDNVEDSESQFMMTDDDEDLKRSKRTKKSEDRVHDHEEGSHEQASAVAAAPAPPDVRVRTRTAVANVTICDADAMECGVCFLALRPPIFQCELGHVVCSSCRDKLEATGNGKCHVCGIATHGYRRCHAMEHLVDCIRVPCPYAAYGCNATPSYHGQESHRQVCPHAPCRCPGESCGFIGSTAALLDHFAGAHNWSCTTKCATLEGPDPARPPVSAPGTGEAFSIGLHFGFNFIILANHARDDGDQQAANCGVPCRLFLLNVTQERLGRAISVLCIHPHASAGAAANGTQQLLSTQCELVFSNLRGGSLCHSHYQSTVFKVVCTDLSNGLPNPEGCFKFFVPNAVLEDGDDKNSIQVEARIVN